MSKKRCRKRPRLHSVVKAAVAASAYILLDAGGRRHALSPLRWDQYLASHAITLVGPGSPVARVKEGYSVRTDADGNAVVVAQQLPEPDIKLRSNYWAVFWHSFIFSDDRRVSFQDLMRAISEDHQKPQFKVVAVWRGHLGRPRVCLITTGDSA